MAAIRQYLGEYAAFVLGGALVGANNYFQIDQMVAKLVDPSGYAGNKNLLWAADTGIAAASFYVVNALLTDRWMPSLTQAGSCLAGSAVYGYLAAVEANTSNTWGQWIGEAGQAGSKTPIERAILNALLAGGLVYGANYASTKL